MNVNGIELEGSFEYGAARIWLSANWKLSYFEEGDFILFYEEDKKALWSALIVEIGYSINYGLDYWELVDIKRLL